MHGVSEGIYVVSGHCKSIGACHSGWIGTSQSRRRSNSASFSLSLFYHRPAQTSNTFLQPTLVAFLSLVLTSVSIHSTLKDVDLITFTIFMFNSLWRYGQMLMKTVDYNKNIVNNNVDLNDLLCYDSNSAYYWGNLL